MCLKINFLEKFLACINIYKKASICIAIKLIAKNEKQRDSRPWYIW